MNFVERPNISNKEVLELCVSNSNNASLVERIESSLCYFEESEVNYVELADSGRIFEITPQDLVNENITGKEMISLYNKMVNKRSPVRPIYDKIRKLYSICPMCGCKETKTLDHFLPKSFYPEFAVNPSNLIPCCRDCNSEKSDDIQTELNGTLHPYFDNVTDVQWLYAKVTLQPIIGFTYYVKKPTEWEANKFNKVQKHFEKFKLDETFRIMASEEYSGFYNTFNDFNGKPKELKGLLGSFYKSNKNNNINHWKTALYGALVESDEYISMHE